MKQHFPVPARRRSTPTLASIDFFSFPRCVFVFVWMTLQHASFSRKCTTTLASQPCHHPSIKRLARHTQTCWGNGEICWNNALPFVLQHTKQGRGWKQVEGLKKLNARWDCAAFPRTGGGWGYHLGEQEGGAEEIRESGGKRRKWQMKKLYL